MKESIQRILLADVIAVRVAVAVVAFLFGYGMLTGAIEDGAYKQMMQLMPAWAWAGALFAYGLSKMYLAAQWPENVHVSFACLVAAVGLFIWSYTFFSFLIDGRSAAETMMAAIIGCEIWIAAHTIAEAQRV